MKTQQPLAPQNTFWTGMLALYRRNGVADACLSLQDTGNIDVVLLLFFRLCDIRGVRLDNDMLAAAELAVKPWRENVILPLRHARRFAKPLACDPAVAANREAIKAREIEAERLELAMLVRFLDEAGPASSIPPFDNADRFLTRNGVPGGVIARFKSLTA